MATQNEKKAQKEENYSEVEKEHKAAQKEDNKAASEVDNAPEVESLIELFHEDVTEVESDDSIDSIDEWVDFLKGHKEEGIKELSASLKELKKLLKGKKSEASEIADTMIKIGEQTNAIGDNAERGIKGPVHKLGKAIITAAHKIEKMAEKAGKGSETK